MSASPGSISPVTSTVCHPSPLSSRVASVAWMAGPPTLSRSMTRKIFMRARSGGRLRARLRRQRAQPDLEREQRPQLLAVIAHAALMLVDDAVDGAAIEPLPQARAVAQVIAEVGAQVLAEPGAERHAEAHLAARANLRRQEVGEGV